MSLATAASEAGSRKISTRDLCVTESLSPIQSESANSI
jgi:hypothetical protein